MKLIKTTCAYCKGHGQAEQLLELTGTGEWVKNTTLPHAMADAWIERDKNAPIKWEDCPCPICDGGGTYELELTPARIF